MSRFTVTASRSTIASEWIDALQESLDVFGSLVIDRPVVGAWASESDLDGYTVGGIAAHVLSLMVGLHRRIESAPVEVRAIPYEDWYRTELSRRELYSGLMQVGEQLASAGPGKVAADLNATSEDLARCLRMARADLVIPLASIRGAGVRLDDLLRTRFVEITVHAADIASSTAMSRPGFPATAWTLAASVVAETTSLQGSGPDFVLSISRPGRVASYDQPTDA